jgi:hypothetical protein
MIVAVNMSRDTYEYFKNYNLSKLADSLLEIYDITTLPPIVGERAVERQINISNENYIHLYKTLGPRSKMVSLGRLFSFAHQMDVLATGQFKIYEDIKEDDPIPPLLEKAYKALAAAKKHSDDPFLEDIVSILYNYKENYDNEQKEEN